MHRDEAMRARHDEILTAARSVFGDDVRLRLLGNGDRLQIPGTPFGLVELVAVTPSGFVVTAESPPDSAPESVVRRLAPGFRDYLGRNGLRVWRMSVYDNPVDVIRDLAHNEGASPTSSPPYAQPLDIRDVETVVGEGRQRMVRKAAALVTAARDSSSAPLLMLSGERGVGRRTLAGAIAGVLGGSAWELPLHRVLVDRVLANPEETLLDALLGTRECEGLVVVSDCQLLLSRVRPPTCKDALAELSSVPNVLLLADPAETQDDLWPLWTGLGLIVWPCRGLQDTEARELLALEFPQVTFTGIQQILNGARTGDGSLLPGRLLYLVNLGWALRHDDGHTGEIAGEYYPDDIAAARMVVDEVWRNRP